MIVAYMFLSKLGRSSGDNVTAEESGAEDAVGDVVGIKLRRTTLGQGM